MFVVVFMGDSAGAVKLERETLRGVSQSTTNQGKENLCLYVSQVTIIITHKSAHRQELGIAPRGNSRVADPGGVEPDPEPTLRKVDPDPILEKSPVSGYF